MVGYEQYTYLLHERHDQRCNATIVFFNVVQFLEAILYGYLTTAPTPSFIYLFFAQYALFNVQSRHSKKRSSTPPSQELALHLQSPHLPWTGCSSPTLSTLT